MTDNKPARYKPTRGQAISALRHRNFQLFFTGQAVSLIGTWMQNIAQSWLILELTNSPFLLGLTSAMQFLPMMVLPLFAGELADRMPKRPLLILTQTSMMLFALILGLLTLTARVRYWHVLILAGLLGTANAFDNPTRQSFIVEMVGREDLMNAITLNSSLINGARVVGPALAGLIIGKFGIAACFLINAASFLAVIAGLMIMRVTNPVRNKRAENSTVHNILEGLQYIRRTPIVLNTVMLMALLNIFAMNQQVLVPIFARANLHQQAAGYGFLASASGIGAVLGGVLLSTISNRGPRRQLLYIGGIGLCVFQILLAATHQFYWSFAVLFLTGLAMNTFVPLANTTVQLNTQDELRGRVMAVYSIAFLGLTPFGSLYSGGIAHLWGAPAAITTGAVIGLGCIAIMFMRERGQRTKSTTTSES